MKTTTTDVITTFINWSQDKSREEVLKLITALAFHYYSKNEIYESADKISNEKGKIELVVSLKKPKPILSIVKTNKEEK